MSNIVYTRWLADRIKTLTVTDRRGRTVTISEDNRQLLIEALRDGKHRMYIVADIEGKRQNIEAGTLAELFS